MVDGFGGMFQGYVGVFLGWRVGCFLLLDVVVSFLGGWGLIGGEEKP